MNFEPRPTSKSGFALKQHNNPKWFKDKLLLHINILRASQNFICTTGCDRICESMVPAKGTYGHTIKIVPTEAVGSELAEILRVVLG